MKKQSRRELLTSAAKAVPVAAVALAPSVASAAPKGNSSATVLINSFTPGTGGFVGTLTVDSFGIVNGLLTAAGTVTGTVLNGAGAAVGSVTAAPFNAAPAAVSASCTILTLTLGPLDLNLLGLMIHLNQVVLNITAVPGAGNLLGNLLCAVANLLNGGLNLGTLLTNLVSVLNQILAAL
jgi:hypothetical protein